MAKSEFESTFSLFASYSATTLFTFLIPLAIYIIVLWFYYIIMWVQDGFKNTSSFVSMSIILAISLFIIFITSYFTKKIMKRYNIKFMSLSEYSNFIDEKNDKD